jgi:hypothetical protein
MLKLPSGEVVTLRRVTHALDPGDLHCSVTEQVCTGAIAPLIVNGTLADGEATLLRSVRTVVTAGGFLSTTEKADDFNPRADWNWVPVSVVDFPFDHFSVM